MPWLEIDYDSPTSWVQAGAIVATCFAAGLVAGVLLVPSPSAEHRAAVATAERCTEQLQVTMHFADAAIARLREVVGIEGGR